MAARLRQNEGQGPVHALRREAHQDCEAEVRMEIAAYKRFKKLKEAWIDLSIETSKSHMKIDKKTGSRYVGIWYL